MMKKMNFIRDPRFFSASARRSILFLALFFLCLNSFSQFSPLWNAPWQHTTSLNYSNESRKVVVDASGNVFVLADVTSDIDPNGIITTNTYHYTVLLKYDSGGNLVDEKELFINNHYVTGFDNMGAFGLEFDAAGNVYVGFTTWSISNNYDVNIIKYDNGLAQIWYYQFKPPGNDFGVDMKVSSAGTAYALVKSISVPDTTFHLVTANASLITVVPFYSFNTNTDFLNRLTVDGNQNIYVTGYKHVAGFKSVLTAKVTAAGNLAWQRVFNGNSANRDDLGNNLTIGADGYLYVTGMSDQGPPANNDIILMKHATGSGKTYWAKFFDYNSGNDQGYFVTVPTVNYVYVASVSGNAVLIDRVQTLSGDGNGRAVYLPDPVEPHSSLNGVSLADFKISPNLNFYITGTVLADDLSGQTFSAFYLAKFIISANSRNLFKLDFENPVTGDFNQSFDAASLALDNLNEDVYWLGDVCLDYANHQIEVVSLIDFDVPVPFKFENGYEKISNTDKDIIIYPALTQNFIFITSTASIPKIELLDLNGKKIKTFTGKKGNSRIELNDFSPGVYVLRIYSDANKITTRKIIKL